MPLAFPELYFFPVLIDMAKKLGSIKKMVMAPRKWKMMVEDMIYVAMDREFGEEVCELSKVKVCSSVRYQWNKWEKAEKAAAMRRHPWWPPMKAMKAMKAKKA